MPERRKTYDGAANRLAWREFGSPEKFAVAAHKLCLTLAMALEHMSTLKLPWDYQERVVQEMIRLKHHGDCICL